MSTAVTSPGASDLRSAAELVRWAGPELTEMASLFRAACREYQARPAYRVNGRWITYGECAERVGRIAASLHGRLAEYRAGTGKQPTIAVLLPNSYHVLESFYTAAVTDSILFPLSHRLSAAEIEAALRASDAVVLLASEESAETLAEIHWDTLPVRTIVWTSARVDLPITEHCSWESLLAESAPSAREPAPPSPYSYLQGFSTSGTTGRTKAVLHSHRNVFVHCFATIQALELSADDDHCWGHFGPMCHVGDAAFVWIAMLLGSRHVFHENQLQFEEVVRLMADEHVTIVKLVPSMLKLVCASESEHLRALEFPDLRWILTGGAAPDPALIHRTATLFDCDFIQGFGMTEATCHVAFKVETQAPMKEGLRILPGLDLKVVDLDDEMVGSGQIGEIVLKGETVFGGYLANGRVETNNSDVFTHDGYYRSGDLGFLDDDGRVHVVGRRKDMINVGGEKVFAWEVEQVVGAMEGVTECAAFSMPNEMLGEVVEVAIVRTGAEPTAARVRERCRKLLANFKVPHRVHFLDELPRTRTGKVQKQRIPERIRDAKASAASPAPPVAPSASLAIEHTIAEIVTTYMAALTSERIDHDRPLFDVGLDSIDAMELLLTLEERFSVELPPTLLYDHPTIADLAVYFAAQDIHAPGASVAERRRVTAELPSMTAEFPRMTAEFRRVTGDFGRVTGELRRLTGEYSRLTAERPTRSAATVARRSATAPGAILLQAVTLVIKPAVLALGIVPFLVLFDVAERRMAAYQLLLLGPLWLALVLLTTMASALLVMRVVGRSTHNECELWTPGYFRWLAGHQLLRALEGPLGVLRGTAILNAFYRLGGAKIGKGVRLESVALHDLDCIHIGDHTIVGRDVNFQPAQIDAGRLVRRPIRVGAHCVIGPNSSLLGGADIPDESAIRPLSAVDSAVPASHAPEAYRTSSESLSRRSRAAGYLVVGYLTAIAIGAGMLFVRYMVEAAGATVPSIAGVLVGGAQSSVPPVFFAAVALAIYFVMPVSYFALVVVSKRFLSHSLYTTVADVPFFAMYLRLNAMSHLTKWNYQLLGSYIGSRPFLAAPYTAEPELLEVGDRGMVAGNVSLYAADASGQRLGYIRVGEAAVVTNSCVLQGGAVLGNAALLGDLSVAGRGDVIPPNAVAVGSPPRVVGRTTLRDDTLSTGRYVRNQSALVLLQWISLSASNVAGFMLMGLVLAGLIAWAPVMVLWLSLPLLLLVPRLVKVAFVPLVKWVALGRVTTGEHPAYGWYYARWVLLETLIMDAEGAFLTQLQGTQFLNLFWRAMGAHVGSNTCILASSLGCEFDLKTIGSDVVMQHQSLVFGHSIEHHSLLLSATTIEDGVEIGPFAIVETGAVVSSGQVVPAHMAVHARRARSQRAEETGLLNAHDFEAAARAKLAKPIFDYYAGGAEDGRALERNRQAFGWVHVCPRVLVDVSTVSTTCHLLERSLASPIAIAPTAMHKLAHPEGESAVATAATRLNMGMIVSMLSNTALEPLGDVLRRSGLPLFQLYVLKDRSLMEELIHRAEASGYQGLVITVDAPASGRREQDIRSRFAQVSQMDLPHLTGRGLTTRSPLIQFESIKESQLTWERLAWLRERTTLPIWLKGILRVEDVLQACERGYDGVVLSNHGGRQLDSALSPLEVLPAARQAVDRAGYRVALLMDGGIRRGSDVFKALGLGADAVLVGRPVLWGLAVNGQAGVSQVLNLLNKELALTMTLAGCAQLSDITPEILYGDPMFRAVSLGGGCGETATVAEPQPK